jgi:hypothetical protein
MIHLPSPSPSTSIVVLLKDYIIRTLKQIMAVVIDCIPSFSASVHDPEIQT